MINTESPSDIFRVGTLTYTKRTLAILFFWLLWGDVCYMLMENVTPSILPLTFKSLGASNKVIGLILMTIPTTINAILNPIISTTSDRYRSKWGRRIPFIVYTLPLLLVSLVGVGYAGRIGPWVVQHLLPNLHQSPATVAIFTIGIFMVLFAFSNTFVGSVFWYLFNDVVPPHLLARFMSLFRLISMLSGAAYQVFIFQYAGTHASEIISGIALLYFFGFSLMCLFVKEGQYAPPPPLAGGRSAVLDGFKTYLTECMSMWHYWLIFLMSFFYALFDCVTGFMIFFYQLTGLNLAQIGKVQGALNLAVGAFIPISGWLADRFHPIRIVIVGYLVALLAAVPATLIWLKWHPDPRIAFIGWMVIVIALMAPRIALIGIYDPPMLMIIMPRSRFGQFCSANNLIRSGGYILGGVLAGAFLDYMGHFVAHKDVYRFIPFWQMTFVTPALICMLLLYRSWKRYGGDESYVAPIPGESLDQRLHEEIVEPEAEQTDMEAPALPV